MTDLDRAILDHFREPSAFQKLLPQRHVQTGKVVTGYNPTITITITGINELRQKMDDVKSVLKTHRATVHEISEWEAARLDRDAIDG